MEHPPSVDSCKGEAVRKGCPSRWAFGSIGRSDRGVGVLFGGDRVSWKREAVLSGTRGYCWKQGCAVRDREVPSREGLAVRRTFGFDGGSPGPEGLGFWGSGNAASELASGAGPSGFESGAGFGNPERVTTSVGAFSGFSAFSPQRSRRGGGRAERGRRGRLNRIAGWETAPQSGLAGQLPTVWGAHS